MTWRDNELALEALAMQGYYNEETKTLAPKQLAVSLRDVFLREPIRASKEDPLEKLIRLFQTGLTKTQVLDLILPGFRSKHELSDEERLLLKKEPKNQNPDLEERDRAISEVITLLWGTYGKTGRSGPVQELMVQKGLLLIEAKGQRNGESVTVKVATDDHDLIIEHYVRPRGDQIVRVSSTVRDDCTMVGMTFEGINERMKGELGGHVTAAIAKLMQVASPDFTASDGAPTRAPRAISSSSSKG